MPTTADLMFNCNHLQPHAIFAAFTHAVVHQWTYLARTVPNISMFITPIEDMIRSNLIPSLTGRAPPGDLERLLLSLPPRLGGLGFTIPTNLSAFEFAAFNDSHTAIIRPHPAKENTLSTQCN